MNAVRFNFGSLYRRPHQSDAATLRQFLLANMGFSIAYIERKLFDQSIIGINIIEQIITLQNVLEKGGVTSIDVQIKGTDRQCPQCAAHLYHSDLYNLTWLPKCPIHNIPFTSHCPGCREKWPNLQEIPKRQCRVCSLFLLRPSMEPVRTIPKPRFNVLKRLYRFVYYKSDSNDYVFGHTALHHCWWPIISVQEQLFPSVQLARNPNIIPRQQITSMGVRLFKLRKNISPLISTDRNYYVQQPRVNFRDQHLVKKLLYMRFSALQLILGLLARRLHQPHKIHIRSYQDLLLSELKGGPLPCPLCMAISLWFFHITSWEYGDVHHVNETDYPFLRELKWGQFQPPYWYKGFRKREQCFDASIRFCEWSYLRNLELCFNDIFTFLLHFIRNLKSLANQRGSHNVLNGKNPPLLALDNHFIDINEIEATVYYEREHPLRDVDFSAEEIPLSQCKAHQSHLDTMHNNYVRFDFSFDSHQLQLKDFISLNEEFQKQFNPAYSR